jgi:hypothetical protein
MTIPKERTEYINGQRCYVGRHNGVPFKQTSIGGLSAYLNKPAINGWMQNRAIDYVMRHHDDLIGMDETDLRREVKGALRASSPEADRGTRIHAIIEELLDEGTVSNDSDAEWVVALIQEALEEMDSWEVVAIERTVCWIREDDDGEDEILAVGTADAILRINGVVWVIDWKSGKRIYPEAAITTAAYAKSTHYLIDGETVPIPAEDLPEQSVVCHVKPSGLVWHAVGEPGLIDPLYEALFAIHWWENEAKEHVFARKKVKPLTRIASLEA